MIDRATSRRLARELISATVIGEVPSVTLLVLAEDADDMFAVVTALTRHARALVRITAEALDVTESEVLDHMAAADWRADDQDDECA
jgi:hypothetical protein